MARRQETRSAAKRATVEKGRRPGQERSVRSQPAAAGGCRPTRVASDALEPGAGGGPAAAARRGTLLLCGPALVSISQEGPMPIMEKTHLRFVIVATVGVAVALVIAMEYGVYGMSSNLREGGIVSTDTNAVYLLNSTPPPLSSQVELRGLQKDVNGISSRYVITNQSPETGILLHTYYDNAGNSVGKAWTSQAPALESRIYALQEIESIPSGYTGYAIIYSDVLITGAVLPPPPLFVYLPLVVKEPPPGVRVLNNHFAYVDTIGYLNIVGEMQNNTPNHLRFVKITANIFNSGGRLLDTEFTYIYLNNLPAGDKTCFHISLEEPVGWSYYEFEAPTYWTDGKPLPNLAVSNDSGSYDSISGWYEIIGQVRNEHGTRVEYVSPVGTLYNASGVVVGCSFTYINSTHLDPGQTSSFKMTFFDRDYADVTMYRLQVGGNPQ